MISEQILKARGRSSYWHLNTNLSQEQRKSNADSLIENIFSFSSQNNLNKENLENLLSFPDPSSATQEDEQRINDQIFHSFASRCQEIKITDYAIEKAEYIVQRFKELREERGISDPFEIAFQMIGEKDSGTIDDVFIDLDQEVTSYRCTMKGKSPTLKQIKEQGKEILAWGHSHTNFETFFSDTDDNTMASFFNRRGYKVELFKDSPPELESLKAKVFYGMVFNEAKDQRALRLVAKIPQLGLTGNQNEKSWQINLLDFDFESTPYETTRKKTQNRQESEGPENTNTSTDPIGLTDQTDQTDPTSSYQEQYSTETHFSNNHVNNWLKEVVIETGRRSF